MLLMMLLGMLFYLFGRLLIPGRKLAFAVLAVP
jgi:hypothetical protein